MLIASSFVHSVSQSSREKLAVTREMLMLCFTRMFVMPLFIDFILPFGHQSQALDEYFSAFRQRTMTSAKRHSIAIPELGWSGSEIQMCYNLRSVERAELSNREWFIRQYAVFHSFDVVNGRTNWIIVKGNHDLKKRVEKATSTQGLSSLSASEMSSVHGAFAASLDTHLVFCDWSAERWRWYIYDLESEMRELSYRALIMPVTRPTASLKKENAGPSQEPADSHAPERVGWGMLKRAISWTTDSSKYLVQMGRCFFNGTTMDTTPSVTQQNIPSVRRSVDDTQASISTLQKLQYTEEQAHKAQLMLNLNLEIVRQLQDHYRFVVQSPGFASIMMEQSSQEDVQHFNLRLSAVVKDLQAHVLRLETLLGVIRGRKALVGHSHCHIHFVY